MADHSNPQTDIADQSMSERRIMRTPRLTERARSNVSPWFKSPFTPRRCPTKLRTPQSRRLICSLRRAQTDGNVKQHEPEFEGLLKKQWKLYSLSPLYNLKTSRVALIKYGRSLDVALSQARSTSVDPLSAGPERSNFSLYEDLRFNPDDPAALRIQVMDQNSSGRRSNVVLEALLVCAEPSSSPVPAQVQGYFTFYPVMLVSGTKARTDVLLDWLERHFDCRTDTLTLSDNDLRYMFAFCSAFITDNNKSPPVLLQYSLDHLCQGIDVINCSLDSHYCKQLWERLFDSHSKNSRIFKSDVEEYVGHIEGLLEHLMNIVFKKLSLSEVGTSAAYVSHLGKIKLFSPTVVCALLHLLCEIANSRLEEIAIQEPLS